MSYSWSAYRVATGCTRYGPAGPAALLAYLKDRFPWVRSLGICNCRSVGGTTTWSHHAECRALDAGIPTTSSGLYIARYGDPIIELLGPVGRRLGLDHLILNRRIYSARSPDGRAYGGVSPHYNHAHIGLTRASAANLTYATIVSVLGPATEGDTMSGLLGFDIGKTGDPSVEDERSVALQDFLVGEGYDLGSFGPNGDGVDGFAGDATRAALHDWKVDVGISPSISAGDGKIGGREHARMLRSGGSEVPPPVDTSSFATKQELQKERSRIDKHVADVVSDRPHS